MLESEPLSSSDEPVFDSFWRSIEIRFILKNVIYTILLILARNSRLTLIAKTGDSFPALYFLFILSFVFLK
ncbi:hypothetical protein LEP1GSC103_2596 [Leptospira borgpetersenii serovar Javanica str. UI 09931]|uniref:Uncharacterized protein n=2 Tax=Leptospira borgpetersenii TaxID=174 RepID=A0ABN0HWW9_LEPBO|nr:hypothetical protein LEP1GSC128_3555 [Leptospira borgpetersenii str. 200801926]EKQ91770.1 hypothetical protein LEP1GSC101_2938 [Leptospira borgpetersenii str. UI 09149]EPG57894.1 hypothetical protein LEP1GSC103_2596 [Leptospira borgpetersenii serovar Javanica str. UI 09931]